MEMGDPKRIIGLKLHMKCSLCDGVYKDATTINLCLHTFCHKCIHKWVEDEYKHHCPECNIELGPSAVTKLRPDHLLRSLRSTVFPDKLKKIKTPEDAPTLSSLVVTAPNLPVPTVKESSMDSSKAELSIMPKFEEDINKEEPASVLVEAEAVRFDSEKKEEKNPLKIRFKIPSSRPPVVPESRKKRNAIPAEINRKPQKKHKNSGPDPPPELPEIFRSVIGEGSDAKLVIQKRLYETDLTDNHNRLSIPLNQVKFEFLMDDEIAYLSTRKEDRKRELESMEVNIIEPSLKVSKISLKKWDLKKLSNQHQKENSSYVLNGTWKKIKQDNQLKVGDVIQLYAYRIEGKLNFALVKLAEIERDTKEIFGGSSSGIM